MRTIGHYNGVTAVSYPVLRMPQDRLHHVLTEKTENLHMTRIADGAIVVTGANRGLGRALVTEALHRGAKRVYAGSRQPLDHPDQRVTPLILDVTNAAQIEAAVDSVDAADVLVNNAGIALLDDLTDRTVIEQHLAVNLFGTWAMTQAFLPLLTKSQGSVINVLSDTAFAAFPLVPGYSISKAAAFALTQSLRALSAPLGVSVHAVVPGPIDTDMSRALNAPKASPESVAQAIFDGLDKGEDDIFPDPVSQRLAENWRTGPTKALERQYAALIAQAATPGHEQHP